MRVKRLIEAGLSFSVVSVMAAAVLVLCSCTAGVDISGAGRVLGYFDIVWPELFVFEVADAEEVSVTIRARDENGELFSWSGAVEIGSNNANVEVGPPVAAVSNGSVNTAITFNNKLLDESQQVRVTLKYGDVVTVIDDIVTVLF